MSAKHGRMEGAEHLSNNWVYGLLPVAKPKDRICQRMDHKEGMFKGELREGKNANPAQIAYMP